MKIITLCFLMIFASIKLNASETGFATYYTEESCKREGTSGVYTASGQKFIEGNLTCAMRCRRWNTLWKVTNLDNGLSVIVKLTDFGPNKTCAAKGIIIDLTPAGFKALGAKKKQGKINVEVEEVKDN